MYGNQFGYQYSGTAGANVAPVTHQVDKDLTYCVVSPLTPTKDLTYCVLTYTKIDAGLTYSVKQTITAVTKSLKYSLTPTPAKTKSLQYCILTTPHVSFYLLNEDGTSVLQETGGKIVIEGVGLPVQQKSLTYHIGITPSAITKSLKYVVPVTVSAITKDLKYVVHLTTAPTKSLRYCIVTTKLKRDSLLQEIGSLLLQETGDRIIIEPAGLLELTYYIEPPYHTQVKSLRYCIVTTPAITVSYLKQENGDFILTEDGFKIILGQNLFDLKYTVKAVASAKTKSLKYEILIHVGAITKSLHYSIERPFPVTKSLKYEVIAPAVAITKSLKYTVIATRSALTKALAYTVIKAVVAITKSLKYAVAAHHIMPGIRLDYRILTNQETVELYHKQNTAYSTQYSAKGTTFTNKYPAKGTTYKYLYHQEERKIVVKSLTYVIA